MSTLLLLWVLWAPISCLVLFLILGPFSPWNNDSLAKAAYLLIWVAFSGIVLTGLWVASVIALVKTRSKPTTPAERPVMKDKT
jgi:hypothetical protein